MLEPHRLRRRFVAGETATEKKKADPHSTSLRAGSKGMTTRKQKQQEKQRQRSNGKGAAQRSAALA
jgi:hypothetical protein